MIEYREFKVVDNPKQQEQASPASFTLDNRVSQETLATLKLQQNLTQNEIQQLLGSAYFSENASLGLSIKAIGTSLVIVPLATTLMGRSESDIDDLQINFAQYGTDVKSVSRRHAVLNRGASVLTIDDLNSTNGTYVNGQRLKTHLSYVLHDGDEIILGDVQIHIAFQYG